VCFLEEIYDLDLIKYIYFRMIACMKRCVGGWLEWGKGLKIGTLSILNLVKLF